MAPGGTQKAHFEQFGGLAANLSKSGLRRLVLQRETLLAAEGGARERGGRAGRPRAGAAAVLAPPTPCAARRATSGEPGGELEP